MKVISYSNEPKASMFRILKNPNLNLKALSIQCGTSVQMLDNYYLKPLTTEMHVDELVT